MEEEIKFLVNKLPNILPKPLYIEQYYFDSTGKSDLLKQEFPKVDLTTINTFRLRKIKYDSNISYILTIKTKGDYKREEYEKEINIELFNLLKQNLVSVIIKNRYVIEVDKFKFEFDEYLNLDEIMYTCEVEYENIIDEKNEIENILNNYFNLEYKDVTLDYRYRNSNLLKYFRKDIK